MAKNKRQEQTFLRQELNEIISERFARYSKYIIQERALPDLRDGLKPVQRRILYSMHDLNLYHNQAYKKSARIVGDVIGKYHPHGDSSIYEAMVRMAQGWKMAYPLVDMHGNIGSIDDDPSAAMRYTETRLAKISNLLLAGINKKIVPFTKNFDDSEMEPIFLPALLPNLLMNGAKGIAAGFATEMPPHNLGELLKAAIILIKNPYATLKKLMKVIKGPDFPLGGIIYGEQGIIDAFKLGRGKIIIASKWKLVEAAQFSEIIISEIPYGVIKAKLIYEIADLAYRQKLNIILDVLDMSDRQGIEILIKIKKETNAAELMEYLFAKTSLQIAYNYNNIVIQNGYPVLLNLGQLLSAYVEHLKKMQRASLNYDYEKAQKRFEIVSGFLKASSIVNDIIALIQKTQGTKAQVIENLKKAFSFSQRQAQAIAEMRLYRLSNTDFEAFKKEKESLSEEIAYLKDLLNNAKSFEKYLIAFLQSLKAYCLPRKTLIVAQSLKMRAQLQNIIEHQKVKVTLSENGYLKRTSLKSFAQNSFSDFKLKDNDRLFFYQELSTKQVLLITTSHGRMVLCPIFKIQEAKWQEWGQHLSEYFKFSEKEKIVSAFSCDLENNHLEISFISQKGIAKRIKVSEIALKLPFRPFRVLKLKSDDLLVSVSLASENQSLLIFTSHSGLAKMALSDLPLLGNLSQGKRLLKLAPGEKVNAAQALNQNDQITLVSHKNYFFNLSNKKIAYSALNSKTKKFLKLKELHKIHFVSKIINWNVIDKVLIWFKNGTTSLVEIDDFKKLNGQEFSRLHNGINQVIEFSKHLEPIKKQIIVLNTENNKTDKEHKANLVDQAKQNLDLQNQKLSLVEDNKSAEKLTNQAKATTFEQINALLDDAELSLNKLRLKQKKIVTKVRKKNK